MKWGKNSTYNHSVHKIHKQIKSKHHSSIICPVCFKKFTFAISEHNKNRFFSANICFKTISDLYADRRTDDVRKSRPEQETEQVASLLDDSVAQSQTRIQRDRQAECLKPVISSNDCNVLSQERMNQLPNSNVQRAVWQLRPKVIQTVQQHVLHEFIWIRRTCDYI